MVGYEWICVDDNVLLDADGFIDSEEDRRFSAEALLSDKGYVRVLFKNNITLVGVPNRCDWLTKITLLQLHELSIKHAGRIASPVRDCVQRRCY